MNVNQEHSRIVGRQDAGMSAWAWREIAPPNYEMNQSQGDPFEAYVRTERRLATAQCRQGEVDPASSLCSTQYPSRSLGDKDYSA